MPLAVPRCLPYTMVPLLAPAQSLKILFGCCLELVWLGPIAQTDIPFS